MGIQGLHKGLSFATKKTTLQEFSGKALAIDSSSWLHRSVYSISEKYVEALERGHVDQQCVRVSAHYVTSRCREILDAFRVAKVFLVMDGKRCPLKTDTNEERERRRQANLSEARDYQRRGRKDKAEEKYKACIKIKDDFTVAVMGEVRRHFANDSRVQLVWSPYEADAQLTKLCVDGAAHAVITEVSLKRTTNCQDIHVMTHQSLFWKLRIQMFLFTQQLHIVLFLSFSNLIVKLEVVMSFPWIGFCRTTNRNLAPRPKHLVH